MCDASPWLQSTRASPHRYCPNSLTRGGVGHVQRPSPPRADAPIPRPATVVCHGADGASPPQHDKRRMRPIRYNNREAAALPVRLP